MVQWVGEHFDKIKHCVEGSTIKLIHINRRLTQREGQKGRQTEGSLLTPSLFFCPHCTREGEVTANMPKKQNKLNSQEPPGPTDLQDFQGKFHLVKFTGDLAFYGNFPNLE